MPPPGTTARPLAHGRSFPRPTGQGGRRPSGAATRCRPGPDRSARAATDRRRRWLNAPCRPSSPGRRDHARMTATEYRAQFDAVVTFSNGGGLHAEGFRVDVPGPGVSAEEVGRLFIASLNLLMVGSVEVRDLSVFAEPHKGTRGGPSDRPAAAGPGPRP